MLPQRARFSSLNYCFFCSSSVVNPASTMIDKSRENSRSSAVSPAKVDWTQALKNHAFGGNSIFLTLSKHYEIKRIW